MCRVAVGCGPNTSRSPTRRSSIPDPKCHAGGAREQADRDIFEQDAHAHNRHFTFAENIGASDYQVAHPRFSLDCDTSTGGARLVKWDTAAPRDLHTTSKALGFPTRISNTTSPTLGTERPGIIRIPRPPAANHAEVQNCHGHGARHETFLFFSRKAGGSFEQRTSSRTRRPCGKYLSRSKGEWSVAKEGERQIAQRDGSVAVAPVISRSDDHACCRTRAGATSLPHRPRVAARSPPREAVAGIDAINKLYAAHSRAARRWPPKMFDARTVVADLLAKATA